MSLRLRLLTGFCLVALLPLGLLAIGLGSRTGALAEAAGREALDRAVATLAARATARRQQARERVAAAAELAATPGFAALELSELARALAPAQGLDFLEILDRQGVRLSSLQWDAGLGLPDDDAVFGDGSWRVETSGSGFAREGRLAVTAESELLRAGERLRLRGGFRLDGAWLEDAAALAGARLAWRDELRGRWYPPAAPGFEGWQPPPLAKGAGAREQPAGASQWSARAVAGGLQLVALAPGPPLPGLVREQRRLTALALAGALLAALGVSLWMAARLSRPVRELADEVTRLPLAGAAGLPEQPWDELQRLARAFDESAEELRASSGRLRQVERVAEWREMARRLAHELKNPLFPMQVSVETLQRAFARRDGGGDPELAALVEQTGAAVLAQIESLRRIVEEFSAFARMPRPRPEAFALPPLLERVAALHRHRAGGVEIAVDSAAAPPELVADAGLLERALGNLVANALDVMAGSGRVLLRARAAADHVLLEVEDDGPGLSPEQQAQVFTPYYTTRRGGTGLGLPIVQAIAADHGGRVELNSEPGRGARFSIRLPRRARAALP